MKVKGIAAESFCLFFWLLSVGCGTRDPRPSDWQRGEAQVGETLEGSRVVATVDGHPITLADVERESASSGRPEETLRRLIDLELLAAEAERRGFAEDAATVKLVDRVTARRLLSKAVAEEITPSTIDEARYRAAYAEATDRFSQPERRDVEHFLARVDEAEADGPDAHVLAQRVLREAQANTNPHEVFVSMRGELSDDAVARVEDLGVLARDASLVAPFLEAAFSLPAAGVVPRVVRTEYGWHVIHVREILPAVDVPFEDARQELEEEVVLEARRQRLEDLLQDLWEEQRVEVDEDAVRTADLGIAP